MTKIWYEVEANFVHKFSNYQYWFHFLLIYIDFCISNSQIYSISIYYDVKLTYIPLITAFSFTVSSISIGSSTRRSPIYSNLSFFFFLRLGGNTWISAPVSSLASASTQLSVNLIPYSLLRVWNARSDRRYFLLKL